MIEHTLETYWPIKSMRERDQYFYLEAIQEYLDGNRVRVAGHRDMLMLGGYSYLGLNGHPAIKEAAHQAIERYGTGAHGVRLLAGTLELHGQLESRIAAFKSTEAAATFTSGFFANVSAIACLVGPKDTVICDKLDHASIVDGCLLSGAKYVRFNHNDTNDLEKRLRDPSNPGRVLVVVDGVYSMDGDIVDLPEVSRLCRKYGATLMVDEAHSVGVVGRTGHGVEEYFDMPPDSVDIKMGTLSKAIPSVGGYIAGSSKLCDYLKHQARGFIYSGALPAGAAAAALAAFDVIEREPERVARLHRNTEHFARALQEAGFNCLKTKTAIFPIVCGENETAFAFARYCQRQGVWIQGIPHPVVRRGMARLRAAVMATHTIEDLDFCVSVLSRGAREIGGILSDGKSHTHVPVGVAVKTSEPIEPAPSGKVSLFSNIDEQARDRFRQLMVVQSYKAGDTIIRQGDEAHEMLLILTGSAEVRKELAGRSHHLDTVGEGDVIGEMAFVTSQPRSASVIAVTDVEALVLTQQTMKRLSITVPDTVVQMLLNLATILSGRLTANTDEWLAAGRPGSPETFVDSM